jgi:subtilisin family serine protease
MKTLLRIALLGSLALVAPVQADAPLEAVAEAQAQQILVMIPIPPPHYRPGAAYGGGYEEQLGARARQRVASDVAQAQHLAVLSRWSMPALAVECFLMSLPAGAPTAPVLQAIARDARVAWVQPVAAYHALGHDDPLYPLQPAAAAWHLTEVHTFTTGRDIIIAVIDSGVETTHPDLQGRVAMARNFVDGTGDRAEAHGTAVAGIIAADADNGIGIVGIAPQARLLALRACWEVDARVTSCNSFTLAKALQFALDHGARIINLSLTGPPDVLLGRLIDAALARGVAVVCAIDPEQPDGGFPADRAGVIAVAAEDAGGAGDIRAPGRAIPATLPGARWGFVDGSSFAAAQIAGALALLEQIDPAVGPREARARLASSVTVARTAGAMLTPTGPLPDLCAVLASAAKVCACACRVHAPSSVVSWK